MQKRKQMDGSYWVAAGILLSRVFGLVREKVLAHFLGNSLEAGAFRAALRIPNFLQNLLGEGTLSASFIPSYSQLKKQPNEAKKLANIVFTFLVIVGGLVTITGMLCSSAITKTLISGFDPVTMSLTTDLVRILFPAVFLLVLSAWCLGILNSHHRFFLSYASPVLWNLAIIIALFILPWLRIGASMRQFALAAAWGVLIGSALQFIVQVPAVLKLNGGVFLDFNLTWAPAKNVFAKLGHAIVSRGVVQLSGFIDQWLASFLGGAAVSAIAFAQTIYMLPISVFGLAVSSSQLPTLSLLAVGSDGHEKIVLQWKKNYQRMMFYVVPSFVVLLCLGQSVVTVLLKGGQFENRDVTWVALIMAGYSLGVIASTVSRLMSSVFWALGDTKTPGKTAGLRLIVSAPLGGICVLILMRGTFNSEGFNIEMCSAMLALAASSGAWLEVLLLKKRLNKLLQLSFEWMYTAKLFGLCIGALSASRLIPLLFELHVENRVIPFVEIFIFGAVYIFLAIVIRIPEVAFLKFWKK